MILIEKLPKTVSLAMIDPRKWVTLYSSRGWEDARSGESFKLCYWHTHCPWHCNKIHLPSLWRGKELLVVFMSCKRSDENVDHVKYSCDSFFPQKHL